MTESLTRLTDLSLSIFREWEGAATPIEPWYTGDEVLQDLQRRANLPLELQAQVKEALSEIFTDSDVLAALSPVDGLSPMVLSVNGGMRMDAAAILSGLFASAAVQIYCLRLSNDEPTYVRTVLDNFEELRRAARGEKVRALAVVGIAGVALPEGTEVVSPWGTLRPAPAVPDNYSFQFHRPKTSCILTDPRLVTVKFDSAEEPRLDFDQEERRSPKASLLFPLACALASTDTEQPAGPIETWSTMVLPFQGGFAYSQATAAYRFRQPTSLDGSVSKLEEWARRIEGAHAPSIDVAATRIVSAIAHRSDRADALIDAVMTWENLLGTESEVTFRVTASLAKLLAKNITDRDEMRKSLAKVYRTRSRIVHGAAVDHSDVDEAATIAIDIAIRALREFYRRGPELIELKSTERSNRLLLAD